MRVHLFRCLFLKAVDYLVTHLRFIVIHLWSTSDSQSDKNALIEKRGSLLAHAMYVLLPMYHLEVKMSSDRITHLVEFDFLTSASVRARDYCTNAEDAAFKAYSLNYKSKSSF